MSTGRLGKELDQKKPENPESPLLFFFPPKFERPVITVMTNLEHKRNLHTVSVSGVRERLLSLLWRTLI